MGFSFLKSHFSLLIGLKDVINFESALKKEKITFYSEISYEMDGGPEFRYYFLKNDKKTVDKICIQENIQWIYA